MAGIYIHIPFCRKACHYCNFHFSTSLAQKPAFLQALSTEIHLVAGGTRFAGPGGYLHDKPVETIYFGGGTPSLLEPEELHNIVRKLYTSFSITPDAELTLETNPDDITPARLLAWKASGINRLSVGVQSFLDTELQWMNRAHSAAQSLQALAWAHEAGFYNITIDLIYGTPSLSDEQWEATVRQAVGLNIPHLSCYALTVEPSTALHHLIRQKKSADVDPEKQARQFLLLMKLMEENGYEHYEISNFARTGMRSRHNTAYWQGKHYAGLGPSAHSFNGVSRQWNVANNAKYISSLQQGILPSETEVLTTTQQLNEYIMTSLRTIEGLDLIHVDQAFGPKALQHIERTIGKYQRTGKISRENGALRLTPEGKLFADGIAADLFVV